MQWKDILIRAGKTFAQAFIASLTVAQGDSIKAILISAVAAGLSAVWNLLQCTILKQEETDGDK